MSLAESSKPEEEVLFPFPGLCGLDYLEGKLYFLVTYWSLFTIEKATNFGAILDAQVQFLDRHHLLIKFGSVDGGVSSLYDTYFRLNITAFDRI